MSKFGRIFRLSVLPKVALWCGLQACDVSTPDRDNFFGPHCRDDEFPMELIYLLSMTGRELRGRGVTAPSSVSVFVALVVVYMLLLQREIRYTRLAKYALLKKVAWLFAIDCAGRFWLFLCINLLLSFRASAVLAREALNVASVLCSTIECHLIWNHKSKIARLSVCVTLFQVFIFRIYFSYILILPSLIHWLEISGGISFDVLALISFSWLGVKKYEEYMRQLLALAQSLTHNPSSRLRHEFDKHSK